MGWVVGGGRRQRRGHDWARWRALTIFLVLFAIAGGVVWWTVKQDKPLVSATPRPCASVRPTAVAEPRSRLHPSAIHVTVLNAAGRRGLAGEVSADLSSRGFAIGRVANAVRPLRGVAIVRSGRRGVAEARLVARLVPGARLVRDQRHGRSVDLVLGRKFHGLAALPVASASAAPSCPQSTASGNTALAH